MQLVFKFSLKSCRSEWISRFWSIQKLTIYRRYPYNHFGVSLRLRDTCWISQFLCKTCAFCKKMEYNVKKRRSTLYIEMNKEPEMKTAMWRAILNLVCILWCTFQNNLMFSLLQSFTVITLAQFKYINVIKCDLRFSLLFDVIHPLKN